MTRFLLVLATTCGLCALAAGSASAKEVTGVRVCGASGCKALTDLKSWTAESPAPALETFDAPVGDYYTVEMSFSYDGQTAGTDVSYWLSGPGLMHGSNPSSYEPWWKPTDAQTAALRAASAGLQPFTPALSRVVVAGKAVADPNSYMRLYGKFLESSRVPPRAPWITIKIVPAHPNPWVQKGRLRYQPQTRLLRRQDAYQVVLPKAIGSLVVKGASLAPHGSGGGHDAVYAGVGAGLAAAGLLAFVRRRRRMS
jgi:hypothetical protein